MFEILQAGERFSGHVHKLSINFELFLPRARGNFEEENGLRAIKNLLLIFAIILLLMHIIMIIV